MSLEPINGLGYGGAKLNDRLPRIVAELQGLTISGPLAGAAAATNIPVPEGIDVEDTLLKVLSQSGTTPFALSDITSSCSITDTRPTGSVTINAGLVAGDTVTVHGKVYTALAGVPSDTNPITSVPQSFIDGVAIAALTPASAGINALAAMGFSIPTATALQAAGALAIATASLAKTIAASDDSLVVSYSGEVVTLKSAAELADGASINLVAGNAHTTVSGATFSTGSAGRPSGTVTLAGALVGDTVTIAGNVYTAVASGSVLELNQFIGGTLVANDLVNLGLDELVAADVIAAGNDKAAALVLAIQVNNYDGARLTANAGLVPPLGDITTDPITAAQAANITNVVTVSADADGPAASSYTLTSSNATREAVSGTGTFSASGRGIQSTAVTTGNLLLVFWFKKSRLIGQW